jgi:hypothetical protein
MKRVLLILVAAGLVLAPYTASVNAQVSTSGRPPIEQPLVSEGEFAVELATALNLTSSHDEAAAEDALASINISPRNGWICDYPMTPDIIAEVRESTARASSSGSLRMAETEAAGIVDSVSTAMNLPIKAAGEKYAYESGSSSGSSSSSEYQSSSGAPPPEVAGYEEPSVVEVPEEEYYGDYGPPIVTYYPPPWNYAYLYDWVPWPFWWGGFGFGGFFILGDFHGYYHHHWISNHVTAANGTVTKVNAVTRATGTAGPGSSTVASRSPQGTRISSANARAGARAIMNRQAGSRTGNTASASTTSQNLASSGSLRNMGNTNGNMRNPVTAAQIMNRLASTDHSQTMSQAAATRSASFIGRSFSSTPSARSLNSGGGGFHGSGLRSGGGGGGHSGGGHSGGGHR